MTENGIGLTLADRCILIDFGFSMPKLTAKDVKATKGAIKKAGADDGTGTFIKRMYTNEDIKPLTRLKDEARSYHYRMTMPWIHQGPRIQPSGMYTDYANRMREYRLAWEKLVDEFVSNYSERLERAETKLVGLFNNSDYPAPEAIRESFEMRCNILPFPSCTDFRADIGIEAIEIVRANEQATIQNAMEDVQHQLVTFVKNLADAPNKGKIFDSLVTNIHDMAQKLPMLNLADDPRLDQIKKDLDTKFATLHPDDLKGEGGKPCAEVIGKEAQKIVDKMSAFGWG
jgi:hypothetical protein